MVGINQQEEGQHDERSFGLRELQHGRNILKVLEATDLNTVDKDAIVGALQAVSSHLANAISALN